MKISKRQLRRIIREELEGSVPRTATRADRWWEYDPKDVMRDVYRQQRQLPPVDQKAWERQWQSVKKQLEKRYPRK